jgi:hypothetical protein
MAGGNEAQRSDRFDLPKNNEVPIPHESEHPNGLAILCGHCAVLRSRLPFHTENKNKWKFLTV